MSSKMASTLSEIVDHSFDHTISFKFTSMWSKYLSNNLWRDFRLPKSASAMITSNGASSENQFCSKFAVKQLNFFRATVANADIISLKSLHIFL